VYTDVAGLKNSLQLRYLALIEAVEVQQEKKTLVDGTCTFLPWSLHLSSSREY
jgi:hypothetical protein